MSLQTVRQLPLHQTSPYLIGSLLIVNIVNFGHRDVCYMARPSHSPDLNTVIIFSEVYKL
jgi:hypothetical protein